jgi:hypothetical protein
LNRRRRSGSHNHRLDRCRSLRNRERRWGHRLRIRCLKCRQIGLRLTQSLLFVPRCKQLLDHIGAIQAIAKAAGAEKIGRLIKGTIEVPAHQIFSARRGIVVTRRGPDNPAFFVGMGKQGQFLGAILGTEPADAAIAQPGHHPTTVAADIHGPGRGRHAVLPKLRAIFGIASHEPLGAKHETAILRLNCQTAGHFALLQRQHSTVGLGNGCVLPAIDIRFAALQRRRHLVGRGRCFQAPHTEIEDVIVAARAILEGNDTAIVAQAEVGATIAEIGTLRLATGNALPAGTETAHAGSAEAAATPPPGKAASDMIVLLKLPTSTAAAVPLLPKASTGKRPLLT